MPCIHSPTAATAVEIAGSRFKLLGDSLMPGCTRDLRTCAASGRFNSAPWAHASQLNDRAHAAPSSVGASCRQVLFGSMLAQVAAGPTCCCLGPLTAAMVKLKPPWQAQSAATSRQARHDGWAWLQSPRSSAETLCSVSAEQRDSGDEQTGWHALLPERCRPEKSDQRLRLRRQQQRHGANWQLYL